MCSCNSVAPPQPPSVKTTPGSLIIVVVLMWRKLREIYGFTPRKERDVTCTFFRTSANTSPPLDYNVKEQGFYVALPCLSVIWVVTVTLVTTQMQMTFSEII